MAQTAAEAGFTNSSDPGYLEWFLSEQPVQTVDPWIDQRRIEPWFDEGYVPAAPEAILGVEMNLTPVPPGDVFQTFPVSIVTPIYEETETYGVDSIQQVGTAIGLLNVYYRGIKVWAMVMSAEAIHAMAMHEGNMKKSGQLAPGGRIELRMLNRKMFKYRMHTRMPGEPTPEDAGDPRASPGSPEWYE